MFSSGSQNNPGALHKRKRAAETQGSPRSVMRSTTVVSSTQNRIVQTVPQLSGNFFKINNVANGQAVSDIVKSYNNLIAKNGEKLCENDASAYFYVLSKKVDQLLSMQENQDYIYKKNNVLILKVIKLLMRDILEVRFAGCTTHTQSLAQADLKNYLTDKATQILTQLNELNEQSDDDDNSLESILPNIKKFIKQLNNVISGKGIADDVSTNSSRSHSRSPVESEVVASQSATTTTIPEQVEVDQSNPRSIPVLAGAMSEYDQLQAELSKAKVTGQFLKRQAREGMAHLDERIKHYATSMLYMKQLPVIARMVDLSSVNIDTQGAVVTSADIEKYADTNDAKKIQELFASIEELMASEEALSVILEPQLKSRRTHVDTELNSQQQALVGLPLIAEIENTLSENDIKEAASIDIGNFDPRLFGSTTLSDRFKAYQEKQAALAARDVRAKQLEEELVASKNALTHSINQTKEELAVLRVYHEECQQLLQDAHSITTRGVSHGK